MKKFLKIVAIVAVVFIAVALVVPLALKSKVGDIVKKEASELLTAEVDFRSLEMCIRDRASGGDYGSGGDGF